MYTHNKIKLGKKTVHFVSATCSQDMADFVEKNHIDRHNAQSNTCHLDQENWDFNAGYDGVAALCKTGWSTGTQSLCNFSDKIRENYKKNRLFEISRVWHQEKNLVLMYPNRKKSLTAISCADILKSK
jgi:hypothetical protein